MILPYISSILCRGFSEGKFIYDLTAIIDFRNIFSIHPVLGGICAICQNDSEKKKIKRVTSDGLIKMFVMDPKKRI